MLRYLSKAFGIVGAENSVLVALFLDLCLIKASVLNLTISNSAPRHALLWVFKTKNDGPMIRIITTRKAVVDTLG